MASSEKDTFSPASSTHSDFEVIDSSPKPNAEDDEKKSSGNTSDEILVIPDEDEEEQEQEEVRRQRHNVVEPEIIVIQEEDEEELGQEAVHPQHNNYVEPEIIVIPVEDEEEQEREEVHLQRSNIAESEIIIIQEEDEEEQDQEEVHLQHNNVIEQDITPMPEGDEDEQEQKVVRLRHNNDIGNEIIIIPEEDKEDQGQEGIRLQRNNVVVPVEESKIEAIHIWNEVSDELELHWKREEEDEDEEVTPKRMRRSLNQDEIIASKTNSNMIEMADRPKWLFLFTRLEELLLNETQEFEPCDKYCRWREAKLLQQLESTCSPCQTYALLYVHNTALDLEKMNPDYVFDPLRDAIDLVRLLDLNAVEVSQIHYGVVVHDSDEPPYRFIVDSTRNPDFIPREWTEAGFLRRKWIEYQHRKINKNVDYKALEAADYHCNAASVAAEVQEKSKAQKILEVLKKMTAGS